MELICVKNWTKISTIYELIKRQKIQELHTQLVQLEIIEVAQVNEADLVAYIIKGIAYHQSEHLYFADAENLDALRRKVKSFGEIVARNRSASTPANVPPMGRCNAFNFPVGSTHCFPQDAASTARRSDNLGLGVARRVALELVFRVAKRAICSYSALAA